MKASPKQALCAALAALLLLAAGCAAQGDPVFVQSVAVLAGLSGAGSVSSFAGVVTAGETASVDLDKDMELDEVKVEVGQTVAEGDVLFTYDDEALTMKLEQTRLELESMNNGLTAKRKEKEELETEREKAKDDDKLSYTLQIQSAEADILEAEYNLKLKEKDLARLEETAGHTQVTAPIAGRIQSIDRSGGTDAMGNPLPFITIQQTDALQVKGTINELNFGAMTEGDDVVLRSRTDDTTWTGTVALIDWSTPVTDQSNQYYYGPVEETGTATTSKYWFYVTFEPTDDLYMGRHVYIEPASASDDTESAACLSISAGFIVDADTDPYVWAEKNGRLEKRSVQIVSYDEMMDTYAIADSTDGGLTSADWIAFPIEGLKAGQPTTHTDPNAASTQPETQAAATVEMGG